MTNKESPNEKPIDSKVQLSPIEPMDGGPAHNALKARLEAALQQDPELKARLSMLANPHLTAAGLHEMVGTWNAGRPALRGVLVAKRFAGHHGKTLTIQMDQEGHVALKSVVEDHE